VLPIGSPVDGTVPPDIDVDLVGPRADRIAVIPEFGLPSVPLRSDRLVEAFDLATALLEAVDRRVLPGVAEPF